LTKEILPLGQETQYQYDANGNLIRKTTPNGHQTEYGYDVMNRPVEIRHTKADGTLARTGTYTWDANHNLTGWSETDHSRNERSSANLAYDDQNRKTQETITYPDGHTQSYRYGYSLAGKKTKLVWPDGTEIGYGYSDHGELNRVMIPGEGTIQINEYGWILPKKTTLPGGITQARGYDGLLNLEGLEVKTPNQQTPLKLTNAYGKEQELKARSRTDTANSTSKTETFAYDDELRLTEVETEGILFNDKEEFTLDAVGNRTQHSESSNPWQYDENNQLTKIGEGNCGSADTICYDYDAAGNRIKKTEGNKQSHYRYDTQNRLIEVSQSNGSNEQLIVRYGYDPFNRRIWKEQFGDKNGQSLVQAKRTCFFYSDEGLLAEEEQDITLNGDGSVTAASQPEIMTQYGPRPESEFTTGILFVKTKNSNNEDTIAYYHHDHLNTPIQATDKQGNIVWSANFNAFGRVTITTPAATAEHPTITSNLRLPGQYADSEIRLHYNWNRYYSPEEGRYITADSIGLAGGINLYGYAEGNPVNFVDPAGEVAQAILIPAAITLGVITIIMTTPEGKKAIGDVLTKIISQMSQHGNNDVAPTKIKDDYGLASSNAKLGNCPPPDRCKWLEDNANNYTDDEVTAAAKAWGCKRSRHFKGGKRR
jgi:RHS repeat-associated protein